MKRANIVLYLSVFAWSGVVASVPESEVYFILDGKVVKVDDSDSLSLRG
ncbi:MAG: hypothetical protein L3J70_04295 [Gammaproteobacteria bacterium]|nr:hypothetical protein [Gammaproteobacteria bacterium]